MIATHLGFFNTSSTRTHVRFQFSTHAAAGGNVAPLSAFEAADLRIYKATDGAAFSATQRSSSSGITMTSPFDSLTGFHDVDIDLTDNTDAGFYASGSTYAIVLAPDTETVDSQTITGVTLAYFEIGVAKADVTQLLGTAWLAPGTAGTPDVNTKLAGGTAWGSGAITPGSIAADAITAAKIADGAIDAATFAAGAITAAAIAADAITAAKVADGTIDANTFAAGAINATAIAADAITAAKIADGAIDAATFATGAITAAAIAADAIGASELAADAITEIQSGLATSAALSTVATAAAAIQAKTDNLPPDPADASDVAGSFSTVNSTLTTIAAYIDTEIAAIKLKTDNLPASPAASTDAATALSTAVAEAYAADNANASVAQLLYEIRALLSEFSITGTTLTAKKKDGSTTAATYTLDSATTPTSITRAT